MAFDTAGDKIGEVGIARLIKRRADTGEHFLSGGTELSLGDLKGQLLHLGFADIARLVSDLGRDWRFGWHDFGSFVWRCNIIHGITITHLESLSTMDFSPRQHYVFSVMHQFQKSRIKLLEELKDLVTESLTESRQYLSRDTRKRNRTLKGIRKEVDKWINEMVETEKLREQERRLNEEKRKKAHELLANPEYGQ